MTRVVVALAFAGVFGVGIYALDRTRFMRKAHAKELDKILEFAQVHVDDRSRALLEAYAARRQRWASIGASIGYAALFPVMLAGDHYLGGSAVILAMGGLFFGSAVGAALSVLRPSGVLSGGVRVAAMQPHGMGDYLRRREVVAEVALTVLGYATVVAGLAVLAGGSALGITDDSVAAVITAGALVAVATTTTLVLQRRLLAAPVRATGPEELVAADVVLCWGLRSLVGIVLASTGLAAELTAFNLVHPRWRIAVYVAAAGVALAATLPRRRRDLAPVAYRLTAQKSAS